jgi:hypothetical protein
MYPDKNGNYHPTRKAAHEASREIRLNEGMTRRGKAWREVALEANRMAEALKVRQLEVTAKVRVELERLQDENARLRDIVEGKKKWEQCVQCKTHVLPGLSLCPDCAKNFFSK